MESSRRNRVATRLGAVALSLALISPGAAFAGEPPAFPQEGSDALARDSWIVTAAPGTDVRAEAPGLAKAAGGRLGQVYEHALRGFQFKGSPMAAAALAKSPRVQSVAPDHPVFLTEIAPIGIERIDAWTSAGDGAYQAGFRGTGARIAILDTGIDLDHPDLVASIDIASGLNCLNAAAAPNDGHGHGTHVAGTAAAPLNGIGVVGVAPEAQLVPIKMFDDAGNSAESLALCALDRVVDLNTDANPGNDIDVANMSWGEHRSSGTCVTDPLHAAICTAANAGITLVAGAGNNAQLADTFVPARYFEVISVSAIADFDGRPGRLAGCAFVPTLFWTECDDTFAFFSNWGWSIDVIAPGVNVYSTTAGGGYQVLDGTSMATPHVAGVVALMAAADPDLTPSEARTILMSTGECPNGAWADADGTAGCANQGNWPDDTDGLGEALVNARRAAEAAATVPPPPPPQPVVPAAPTLTSAAGDTDSIALTWTTPADGGTPITDYQVWRGTTSGGETLLATVGVLQAWDDTSAVAGQVYWYQVAAVNAVGPGPRSNEQSAALVRPPSAPTLLGAPADRTVILSWTAPSDTGGSPITAYEVYRSVAASPESLLTATAATATTYVDQELANGTAYTYRVVAWNLAGPGDSSNSVTVIPTLDVDSPSPPQALSASKAKSSFSIVLKWSAPASDGGSPIATYLVYRREPGASAFTLIGWTDTATRTFTDGGVARRTSYTYAVTAFNSYFESAQSNQVTITSK